MMSFSKKVIIIYLFTLISIINQTIADLNITNNPMCGESLTISEPSLCITTSPQLGCPLSFFGPNKKENLLYDKAAWAIPAETLLISINNTDQSIELFDKAMTVDSGVDTNGYPALILTTVIHLKQGNIKVIRTLFINPKQRSLTGKVEIISCQNVSIKQYQMSILWKRSLKLQLGKNLPISFGEFGPQICNSGQSISLLYGDVKTNIAPLSNALMMVKKRGYAAETVIQSFLFFKKTQANRTIQWKVWLGEEEKTFTESPKLKKILDHDIIAQAEPIAISDNSDHFPLIGVDSYKSRNFPVLFASCGIKFMRFLPGWPQPKKDAEINFDSAEELITRNAMYGLKSLACLSGTPSWASKDGDRRSPPKDIKAYSKYLKKFVTKFKGRILAYEIWNEPDIKHFFTGDVNDYVKTLEAAYKAIKSVDSEAVVISAGLDGPGEAYLIEMLKLGSGKWCDGIGFHPYGQTPAVVRRRLKAVRNILKTFGIKKKIWITELGWQTGVWKSGPGHAGNEHNKAAYLKEIFTNLPQDISVATWYTGREGRGMFGLVQANAEYGFSILPAFKEMQKITKAKPEEDVQFLLPPKIKLHVGESFELKIPVKNRLNHILQPKVRLEGLNPNWYEISPLTLEAGSESILVIKFKIPKFTKSGEFDFIVGLGHLERGLLAAKLSRLYVINNATYIDIKTYKKWSILLNEKGEEVGKWEPTSKRTVYPGQLLRQPLVIENEGNFKSEFSISFDGFVSDWAKPNISKFEIKPGQKKYITVDIQIPVNAVKGPKKLTIIIQNMTVTSICKKTDIKLNVGTPPTEPQ